MTMNQRHAARRRIEHINRARALAARGQLARARNLVAGHPGQVVVIEVNSATHSDTEERRQYSCAAMRAQLHNRFDTTDANQEHDREAPRD